MSRATNEQTSFAGEYWSPFAHGRFDDPAYRTGMSECFNGYPISEEAWVRRPGFRSVSYTHKGRPGKLLPLAGENVAAYNIELTSETLRMFHGASLLTQGNHQQINDITAANPAVFSTAQEHGWSTGDHVVFDAKNADGAQALADFINRAWSIEVLDEFRFIIHDYFTDEGYDGTDLVWSDNYLLYAEKILQLDTDYVDGTWKTARVIQSDDDIVLLNKGYEMQTLVLSRAGKYAVASASIAPSNLVDGPYYDPVSGSIATPSALDGVIDLDFSLEAWDSAHAYKQGDYVLYSTRHYVSLTDGNQNNQPDTSTDDWQTTTMLGFVNNGYGFTDRDIGRHIRLYSEPPDWDTAENYTEGNLVKFNDQYWSALKSMTGATPSAGDANPNQPGLAADTWVVNTSAARWTWGKITSINTAARISTAGSDGTPIGDMTEYRGLSELINSEALGRDNLSAVHTGLTGYCGMHFNVATKVSSARLFPSWRTKLAFQDLTPSLTANPLGPAGFTFGAFITANVKISLYASNTEPTSSTDGTLLGDTGDDPIAYEDVGAAPITITSDDDTTTWEWVWFNIEIFPVQPPGWFHNEDAYENPKVCASEMEFYSEAGHAGGGVSVQILGDPLLYVDDIRLWRLGRYNNSEPNWPGVGCYYQGRFLLFTGAGFDVSRANEPLNFAPTDPDGTVTEAHAFRYDYNFTIKNEALWAVPGAGGVVVGTAAGEIIITSPTAGSLNVFNVSADIKTEYGSADVDPVRTKLATVFVHQNGRDVHEYLRDAYSGALVAPSLSERARSLSDGKITQVSYQQALVPVVWACTSKGALIGTTYKRTNLLSEQPSSLNGWHHHEHGGNRDVISVSVGPSILGTLDALAVITQDREDGLCRYEVATDLLEPEATIFDCQLLDGFTVAVAGRTEELVVDSEDPGTPGFWEVPGYELIGQCSALVRDPAPDPSVEALDNPPATAEPTLTAEEAAAVWLTPPSSIAMGGCPNFQSSAQWDIPGVDVFIPGPMAAFFTIAQFSTAAFGSIGWRRYQLWQRLPGATESITTPVWNPPTGSPSTLVDLEGVKLLGFGDYKFETMDVFVAGLYLGEYIVAEDGTIFLGWESDENGFFTERYLTQVSAYLADQPFNPLSVPIDNGKYVVPVVVGYKYLSRGRTLRPIASGQTGAKNGSGFAKLRREHNAAFLLHNSFGMKFGSDFDHLDDAQLRTTGQERNLSPTELFSGIFEDTIDDDSGFDGTIAWQIEKPYPLHVLAVGAALKTQDR